MMGLAESTLLCTMAFFPGSAAGAAALKYI